MAVSEAKVDQFRNLIGNMDAVEKENEDLKEQLAAADARLLKEIEDNKALKQFQWIIDADIDYWNLTVRDRTVVDGLLARGAQVFGERFKKDVTADDKEINRYARQHMDFIVTACVRYAVLHEDAWIKVYAKYIKDHARMADSEE